MKLSRVAQLTSTDSVVGLRHNEQGPLHGFAAIGLVGSSGSAANTTQKICWTKPRAIIWGLNLDLQAACFFDRIQFSGDLSAPLTADASCMGSR